MTDLDRLLEIERELIELDSGDYNKRYELTVEKKSLYEKLSKAEERFNKGVFVKCKLPECFPEHKYIEKEDIFYCKKLNIGDVNWD